MNSVLYWIVYTYIAYTQITHRSVTFFMLGMTEAAATDKTLLTLHTVLFSLFFRCIKAVWFPSGQWREPWWQASCYALNKRHDNRPWAVSPNMLITDAMAFATHTRMHSRRHANMHARMPHDISRFFFPWPHMANHRHLPRSAHFFV